MTSVIGTKFTIDQTCATHRTVIGMHAVIVKYAMNESRSPPRKEAEIMVWKAEDEEHGAVAAAYFKPDDGAGAVAAAPDA